MKNFSLFLLLFVVSFQMKAQTILSGDHKITGKLQVENQLDVLNETPYATRSILARLPFETAFDVRAFDVSPAYGKLFSIGTTFFYGCRNTAINFYRGGSEWGGFITMEVWNGTEICKFSYRGLDVYGILQAKEIVVSNTGWADHVFADDYQLPPLDEVKQYITENKHLPGIPTETEVKEEGVNLGDMQVKLLQKIEELTLYVIRQQEMIDGLKSRIGELENERKK